MSATITLDRDFLREHRVISCAPRLGRPLGRRYQARADLGYSHNKRLQVAALGVNANSFDYLFAGFAVQPPVWLQLGSVPGVPVERPDPGFVGLHAGSALQPHRGPARVDLWSGLALSGRSGSIDSRLRNWQPERKLG